MTDVETLDRARLLFVGDTQGDRLAREVITIAERCLAQNHALHRRLESVWSEFLERIDR